MKALKFARAWRWVLAGLIGCQGVSAGLDLFWWHTYMLVLFPVALSCALVFAVRLNARTIANLEVAERARWRPDYAHIARMEREVYGETFRHDGAPEGGGWRIVGAQMEVSHPIASGADLAAAMAALGDTMREASVPIGHAVRHCPASGNLIARNCPAGHPYSEMYWSQQKGAFCRGCEQERIVSLFGIPPNDVGAPPRRTSEEK